MPTHYTVQRATRAIVLFFFSSLAGSLSLKRIFSLSLGQAGSSVLSCICFIFRHLLGGICLLHRLQCCDTADSHAEIIVSLCQNVEYEGCDDVRSRSVRYANLHCSCHDLVSYG